MYSSKSNDSRDAHKKIRQLEEQVDDYRRLNRILVEVSAANQVEGTLKRIVEGTLLLCQADQGSIRLNVVNLTLPPLRERKEDIPVLADHFLRTMNEKYDKQIRGFQTGTISHLEAYAWPGNIRELEHAMERAVVLCQSDRLSQTDFPFLESRPAITGELFRPRPWEEALVELKKHYLSKILEHTGGVKKHAAEILQIQPTYLSRLLKNLKIEE